MDILDTSRSKLRQKSRSYICGRLMCVNIVAFGIGFSLALCLSSMFYLHSNCSFLELEIRDKQHTSGPKQISNTTPSTSPTTPKVLYPEYRKPFIRSLPARNATVTDDLKFWMPSGSWTYSDKYMNDPNIVTYTRVLGRLGAPVQSQEEDWDVTWSTMTSISKNKDKLPKIFKPYQRINFVPGMSLVTSKDVLLAKELPYMAKSFSLSTDMGKYHEYVKQHPEKKWLYKERQHRGLGVRFPTKSDLVKPNKYSMLQEFIVDPLIIDKRKMELAVYTSVMSVDPLRVYINDGDWYPRFCSEEYYPFDINNTDKYIMQSTNHLWTWQMPSLKYGYEVLKLSNKDNLFSYLRRKGLDPDKMEVIMRDVIRHVYTIMEKEVIKEWKTKWKSYGQLHRNFFELHRFDFVLDSKLNVYLIEVNLNPGIRSHKDPERRQQNERTVYGLFSLAGMVSNPRKPLGRSTGHEKEMRVYSKDFSVFSDLYWSNQCASNCSQKECRLSVPCLSEDEVVMLENAVHEHFHRLDWVRIVPEPFKSQEAARTWDRLQDPHFLQLTQRSRWMAEWFWGKCLTDQTWCS